MYGLHAAPRGQRSPQGPVFNLASALRLAARYIKTGASVTVSIMKAKRIS